MFIFKDNKVEYLHFYQAMRPSGFRQYFIWIIFYLRKHTLLFELLAPIDEINTSPAKG